MSKQETIIEIMNLYDENERLKNEIKNLQLCASNSKTCECVENKPNLIDLLMIEKGKKEILNDCLYSWKSCECTYDEEKEIYVVTKYEKWLNNKIKNDYLPKEMSFNDFKDYFRKELQEMYEKEKTKVLNEARNIENVEEE